MNSRFKAVTPVSITLKENNMIKLLEAVPLSVFLLYIRNIDADIPQNWEAPYIVSGLVAIAVTASFLYKKRMLNRIFLGINIYLVSGGVAFITHQWWLNRIYGDLQASGLLLWIIIAGIVTALFSPKGFIGVDSSDKKSIKKYSYYLLLFSVGAFTISFGFRDNRLLSEIVPFIGLFLIQKSLKEKLIEKNTQSPRSDSGL